MATASSTPKRHRRRLRSRIIISSLLLGSLLAILFAVAVLVLRDWLENRLFDDTLSRELANYAQQFRADPTNDLGTYSKIEGYVISKRNFGNVQLEWRYLDNGVHRIVENGSHEGHAAYKLAVLKDDDYWFFLRYDVTQEEQGRIALSIALVVTVVVFSGLAWLLGVWSSSRVMAPVSELAQRIEQLGSRGETEALAGHFADDEVGQVASALDDYALRLTQLVARDREFNSDVSHELRTPLAVILSTVELLLAMPDLSDRARDRLRRIERAAKQSTELTTALLHLSRGERQAPSEGETTEVGKVLDQLLETHRSQLGRKPLTLELIKEAEVQVDAPQSVIAVAVGNLLGNAIKYTSEGVVRVRLEADRVLVEDTGPGISQHEADRLFERNYRGVGATGSGAGLGLAIVSRLCDLYGWRASMEPREGGGARAMLDFSPPP